MSNKTSTKRSQAITIFTNNVPSKEKLGDTKFRATVIGKIMKKSDVSHASAASLYNHAKKAAQTAGTVAAFGRIAVEGTETDVIAKAKLEDAEQEEVFELLAWAVVNKKTREIVDTFKSRRDAQAAKGDDETVAKTADVQAAAEAKAAEQVEQDAPEA